MILSRGYRVMTPSHIMELPLLISMRDKAAEMVSLCLRYNQSPLISFYYGVVTCNYLHSEPSDLFCPVFDIISNPMQVPQLQIIAKYLRTQRHAVPLPLLWK